MSASAESSHEILDWLEAHRADTIGFARQLIATPSQNPPGDERLIAAVVEEELRRLGFDDISIVAKEPHRPNVVCRLVGASGGPTLLYSGHIDTKRVGDRSKWHTDPLEPTTRDGILYGLGSSDMKSAIAAFVWAAGALLPFRDRIAGELVLALTADEEAGGEYGAQFLAENGHVRADVGLIGEPSGIRNEWEDLDLVSRGETCFVIKVRGTQMHASVSDVLPSVNATLRAAHVLLRLDRDLQVCYTPHPLCPQGITVCPGVMFRGGVFYGILPGYAEFSTEIRTVPGMTREAVRSDVQAFVQRLRAEDPSLEIEVEFEPLPLGWVEPVEVPPDEPFVGALFSAARAVLGFEPRLSAFPAWTDARFFAETGIPTIPAFGPGLLTAAHSPNECIVVESIVQASKIYALAAWDFLSSDGKP